MEQTSYVVVFPTIFSKNKIPQIVTNIKKILKAKNQQFRTVKRDGDIILVDANDPVFASSAINLLFGIEKIAIARQVRNDFGRIVSEIAAVGGNLLLKGERFLVRVDGLSRGFLTKDVELAATSEIIEKKANVGAKPGTEQNHDKILYCHLTRNNAYVCIFSDDGMGGIPFRSDKHDAVCCIFDEVSAISCYETMKQGYNPKIIVCYNKKSELINIAKMANQILPRLLKEEVSVEVFHIKNVPTGKSRYSRLVSMILEILIKNAESYNISHVSVPVFPLTLSNGFVDDLASRVFGKKKMPILPLSGLDLGVFADARELGLERHFQRMTKLFSRQYEDAGFARKDLDMVLGSRQEVSMRIGPNNVHDFLDSLEIIRI